MSEINELKIKVSEQKGDIDIHKATIRGLKKQLEECREEKKVSDLALAKALDDLATIRSAVERAKKAVDQNTKLREACRTMAITLEAAATMGLLKPSEGVAAALEKMAEAVKEG